MTNDSHWTILSLTGTMSGKSTHIMKQSIDTWDVIVIHIEVKLNHISRNQDTLSEIPQNFALRVYGII